MEVCNSHPDSIKLYNKHNLDFILKDSSELICESLEGARRARDIIKNLRNFSHPDENTISTINILELIEDTVRIANTQVKKNAKIKISHDLNHAFTQGNATQLSQVILNLINNAHHSIEHQYGLIEISINKFNNWINVVIEDNGCGIEDADIPHIFEPFFTTKEIGQGTGLGLSVSRAIIEQHNGCIALVHTGLKGTKFVISLPESNHVRDDKKP